jgi:hypothetical protein
MDMWAIQIAGKRGPDMNKRLEKVNMAVREAQNYLLATPILLRDSLNSAEVTGSYNTSLIAKLNALQFDTKTNRPLTLTEMFIFLGVANADRRESVISLWEKKLTALIRNQTEFINPGNPALSTFQMPLPVEEKGRVLQPALLATHKSNLVHLKNVRLALGLYGSSENRNNQASSDHAGMGKFFDALNSYGIPKSYSQYKQLADKARESTNREDMQEAQKDIQAVHPEYMRRVSTIGDQQLKAAVDAFTADMNELFLQPLLAQLQVNTVAAGTKSFAGGVSLVGQTRLVVSSGLETALDPKLESYVDTTRPKTLTPETLKNALDGTGILGTALPGLTPEHLRALAVFFAQPEEQITRIAPGLGINIRPTVMPDGNTARLQINMRVGVETSQQKAGKDVLDWKPADAVKEHKVTTDAIINGFDLFNISSFAITSSHPRPPGYVPVLGTLPWIGRVFQWRRSDVQADHHSMILVNAVILPRAMDVARFYGQ